MASCRHESRAPARAVGKTGVFGPTLLADQAVTTLRGTGEAAPGEEPARPLRRGKASAGTAPKRAAALAGKRRRLLGAAALTAVSSPSAASPAPLRSRSCRPNGEGDTESGRGDEGTGALDRTKGLHYTLHP